MALTGKQRAYLRSEANDIDAELHIGKSDIGDTIVQELEDLLRTRELVKISVLKASSLSPREVADTLANETRSDVVQVIGRKIVLYKFSEELAKKDKSRFVLPR